LTDTLEIGELVEVVFKEDHQLWIVPQPDVRGRRLLSKTAHREPGIIVEQSGRWRRCLIDGGKLKWFDRNELKVISGKNVKDSGDVV